MKKFAFAAAAAFVLIAANASAQTQGGGAVSVPGEAEDIVIAPIRALSRKCASTAWHSTSAP
jgi:hypothetical protein